jgi:hypothetical protein
MPLVYLNVADCDTDEAKALYFSLPEVDAINTTTAITFGGCGLTNLKAAPTEVFITEITNAAATPTIATSFTITLATAFGFTATKTSVTVANAVVHNYVIYFHTRPFYG